MRKGEKEPNESKKDVERKAMTKKRIGRIWNNRPRRISPVKKKMVKNM